MKNNRITGVILAAGKASRYGADKRLANIDGQAMLLHVANRLSAILPDTLVVLAHDDHALATQLRDNNITCLQCTDTDQGMGHSLACAVKARPDSLAWLVCLADMPYIETTTYQAVINSMLAGASLCAPCFQGKRGHPVAFSRSYRYELTSLTGDKGARDLLSRHNDKLIKLHVTDPGVLVDIDQPQNLSRPLVNAV